MDSNTYIDFLRKSRNQLKSDNEVLIVRNIISNLGSIYTVKVEDLARDSYLSKTTIIRLLKRFGFESYTDFRESLSRDYQRLVIPEPVARVTAKGSLEEEHIAAVLESHMNKITDYYQHFDDSQVRIIVDKMMRARSVTIIGDYRSLEIFHLLMLTLNMYGKPCYIFKQPDILKIHLKSRTQSDLCVYLEGDTFDSSEYLGINNGVDKIFIGCKSSSFKAGEDAFFPLIKDESFREQQLQFVGLTIVFYVSLWKREQEHGEKK